MKIPKKHLAFALANVLMLSALAGCGSKDDGDPAKFDTAREINVLTREEGSGTRGAEAYLEKNPGVTIELQQSDSSTGMSDTIDGTCDIGMASRELEDSEIEKGLTATVIAMDGITVIVNNDCPINDLTSEQVKEIFMGDTVS